MLQAANIIGSLVRSLPDSWVFSKSFRYAKRISESFESVLDKKDYVCSYQEKILKDIFTLATKTIYYREYNFELGIETLPFIQKETIVSNFNDFIITTNKADLVSTGGTSGKPLVFYIDKLRKGFEWYWMTSNWSNVDFDLHKSYRAVLRNHNLENKLYKRNSLLKEIQFNNFCLSDEYLDYIINFIAINKIPYVHAYPSAACQLAHRALQSGRVLPDLKSFLCGSETIYKHQKDTIQNLLGKRMYTWYGHSEKLILAGEGRKCEYYHHNPFYGFAELVNQHGDVIRNPGEIGELVGTGFINTKMPFIRYKTGDFAEFVGNECPVCGHIGLTFKNVRGRWSGERIIKNNGDYVTTTSLNLHNDIYKHINGFQYVQNVKGIVEIRVIPADSWNLEIANRLVSDIEAKVGHELKFICKEVTELEFAKNRKYKLLVQNIEE